MRCVARVIRAILGSSAIADRKLEHGVPLVILGLRVEAADGGIRVSPDADKVTKWCGVIEEALRTGALPSGAAAKLAGKLNFAAQHTFYRVGRAMIRPIYDQQYHPKAKGKLPEVLVQAL
eukprot:1925114-Alexandrium_andersonii.AAC.1